MPQPLSKFDPTFLNSGKGLSHSHMGMAGGKPKSNFRKGNSKFAMLAMDAITKWATVENAMLMTVSQISGGPKGRIFRDFSDLRSRTPKTAVFKAVLNVLLHQDASDFVPKTMTFYASCEKRRNALVHHAWGQLQDNKDVVLLSDAKALYNKDREGVVKATMVWTIQDFDGLILDIHDLHKCIQLFPELRKDRFELLSPEAKKTYLSTYAEKLDGRGF